MDKFRILKNGLVLTLDKLHRAGYYTVVIKNDRIAEIDFDRRFNIENFLIRYPQAEVVDCEGQLLTPAFINCSNNTIHNLLRFFIKKATFDDLDNEGSRNNINNFLLSEENHYALKSLEEIAHTRSLFRGESITVETSEIYDQSGIKSQNKRTFHLLSSDKIQPHIDTNENHEHLIPMLGRKDEINNYSLSSFKKKSSALAGNTYLQLFKSGKRMDELKGILGRSVVKTFYELGILNKNSLLADPLELNNAELDLLADKKIPVLIEPSDIKKFSASKNGCANFFGKKLCLLVGTGSTGCDLLSELKQLSSMANSSLTTFEDLLKTVTVNPACFFNMDEQRGSLEKNKCADIIAWDVNSFSNALDIPEIDSEMISEFLIERLAIQDLRRLIVNGIDELDEKIISKADSSKVKELIKKLYGSEKFSDTKERNLFKKKNADEDISPPVEESVNMFSERDKYENIPIESISEFKLKGTLVLEAHAEFAASDELTGELPSEINSIDDGLNLLDEELVFSDDNEISNKDYLSLKEFDGPVSVNKISEIKKPVKKIFFDDEVISAEEIALQKKIAEQNKEISEPKGSAFTAGTKPLITKTISPEVKPEQKHPESKENREVKFKASKLKFGFSSDDSKDENK